MKPSQISALLLALLVGNVTCGLGGCVIVKEGGSQGEWAATMPVPPPAVPPSSGAIYQSYNSVSLFNDLRARRVGDIITVRLSERTAASKSSSTNSSKTTDVSIASPTVLGTDVTYDGTQFLSGSMEADQSFSGAGDSAQSNSLTGDISVTVMQVLSNGNLVVRGEKHVTLNQGSEYIRLSGIVRQADILPDNSVLSAKIANAQIAYSGKGALADANRMSWLGRFFNSPIMPF